MKTTPGSLAALQKEYERLRESLAPMGYISQGSVIDRSRLHPPRSGYQWTRKVKGKTVTVALSRDEFEELRRALANERTLNETIRRMERISRRILFRNRPEPTRSKRLRQKVLGLI